MKANTLKKIILAAISITIIFLIIIIIDPVNTDAKSSDNQYKYFTSIEIEEGDSLWSIAEEYMNYESTSDYYTDINDYIDELKSMNNLSDDTIHSGANIIVAYYSEEIK